MVGFRSPPEITEALDKAAAEQPDGTTRSGIIRRIVTDWLRQQGYLPK